MVYPTSKNRIEQIKTAGEESRKLCYKFDILQTSTIFGRALNLNSFVTSPLRFKMYAFDNCERVKEGLQSTQKAMNKYLSPLIRGKAMYWPIKRCKVEPYTYVTSMSTAWPTIFKNYSPQSLKTTIYT